MSEAALGLSLCGLLLIMGAVHCLVAKHGLYIRWTLLVAAGFDSHRLHNSKLKVICRTEQLMSSPFAYFLPRLLCGSFNGFLLYS
jgi:hypothetical protein